MDKAYEKLVNTKTSFINTNFGNLKSSAIDNKIKEADHIIEDFQSRVDSVTRDLNENVKKRNEIKTVYTEDDMVGNFFGAPIANVTAQFQVNIGTAVIGTEKEKEDYLLAKETVNKMIEDLEVELNDLRRDIRELEEVKSELSDKKDVIIAEEKLFGDLSFATEAEKNIAIANSRVLARTLEPILHRFKEIEDSIDGLERSMKRSLRSIEESIERVNEKLSEK